MGACTLSQYETSKTTLLKKIELHVNEDHRNMISDNRAKYIDGIITEINKQFRSVDFLNNFSILDPKNLPAFGSTLIDTYGIQEVTSIHSFYKWSSPINLLLSDWKKLIESIIADKDYVRKKTKLQLEHF